MEITQKDLLAFNGMIITGMLFFFALGNEIPEKNLIVYGMVFPLLLSIAAVIFILEGSKLTRTVSITQVSLGVLFLVLSVIFVDIIILDNYISDNISVKSWIPVNKTS